MGEGLGWGGKIHRVYAEGFVTPHPLALLATLSLKERVYTSYITAPICQGMNSLSPKPSASDLDSAPLAISRK